MSVKDSVGYMSSRGMMFVRLYTGTDGQSHFEDLDLHTWPADWSMTLETAEIRFRHRSPGHFWDWHNESRRQYAVILSGQIEAVVGDGSRRQFSPGDVVLAEDVTGQGHTTRIVSAVPLVYVTIPVAGSGIADTRILT